METVYEQAVLPGPRLARHRLRLVGQGKQLLVGLGASPGRLSQVPLLRPRFQPGLALAALLGSLSFRPLLLLDSPVLGQQVLEGEILV